MKLLKNTTVLLSLLLIMGLCINGYNFQNSEDEDEETGNEDTNQDEEASGNGLPANEEEPAEQVKTERIQQPTRQPVAPAATKAINLDDTVNDQQGLDDISETNDNDDEENNEDTEDEEEDSNDSSQNNDEEKDTESIKQPVDVSSTIVTPPFKSSRSKLLAIISKPGILAGIVGGAIIGILTAILLIMFIVYRMRKKDEGSYALEETKKPLNAYDYRHCPTKEFYA